MLYYTKKYSSNYLVSIFGKKVKNHCIFFSFRSTFFFLFTIFQINITYAQTGSETCNCKEYLYVNDVDNDQIHKFAINPATGGLTEIGSPWRDNFFRPHGLANDLNGFLYVSRGTGRPLTKLTCDGEIVLPNPAIPNPLDVGGNPVTFRSTNFSSHDGVLYVHSDLQDQIVAVRLCDGSVIGSVALPNGGDVISWGHYNDGEYMYLPNRANGGEVFRVALDTTLFTIPATNFATLLFESVNGGLMGMTRDGYGNFYIVESQSVDGSNNNIKIVKYDQNGTYLTDVTTATSDGENLTDGLEGWWGTRQLVWSETTNKLYLGPMENCVTVFDTDLNELVNLNIGNPTSGSSKTIGINKECCPSPPTAIINKNICEENQIGKKYFLNQIFPCEGIVCGGIWADSNLSGMTYDDCDHSITITSEEACGIFTRSSDGSSPNSICGAFDLTFNLKFLGITAPVITGNAPTCANGNDPAAFTIITPALSSSTITYRWQNSTTDCTTGFTDIVNAPTDGTPYDPPALSQETYYRVIVEVSGTCLSGMCADTSNCVLLTPEVLPSFSVVGSPTNPSACGSCDGAISLRFEHVPSGIYTINYEDASGMAQTFDNVTVASGSFQFASITGLCAGTYNNLSITVSGCISMVDIDFILTETCYDYGDLPDTSSTTNVSDYQTLSTNNGPAHLIISGLSLGNTVDDEIDGQSSSDALGDGADEDGLIRLTSLVLYPGQTLLLPFSYTNTTGNTAHVEAWIDWNADGAFDDTGEMVIDWNDGGGTLPDRVEIIIPATAQISSLLGWRIRISNQDNMTPYGVQPNGEVEDYLIGIACPQVCLPIQATIIRQ